jgi:hypothetical protein
MPIRYGRRWNRPLDPVFRSLIPLLSLGLAAHCRLARARGD